MNYTPKRWVRLGLGAALLGTASLAACGGEGGEGGEAGEHGATAAAHGEAGESGEGEGGESGEGEGGEGVVALDPALLLPIDERAALMSGHVSSAMALAAAGASEDAAAQLRMAIDEVKPGGMTRLVENGLDPDAFEAAAAALEAGEPADAALAEVTEDMSTLRERAAGDPVHLVAYLAKHCLRAYRDGVSLDNQVANLAEYQAAYGYAVQARELASTLPADKAGDLQLELELLVRMWPSGGPLAGSAPAPLMTFAGQVSRVELELSTLQ